MTPIFKLFGMTLTEEVYNTTDYYIFAGMTMIQKYLNEIYFIAFITFCIAFSFDLYSTIKNPLKSPDKRMKFYYISIIVNLVGLLIIEGVTIPRCSIFKAMDISDS